MKQIFPLSLLLIVLNILISSCFNKPISLSETQIALGTFVKIDIITDKKNREKARGSLEDAFRQIKEFEKNFDYRSTDGYLYQFNINSILLREENSELFSLLSESLTIAKLTDGYFDPTILPIIQLWGFDTESPHLPSREEIMKTLTYVDYRKVKVTSDRIEKPLMTKFDLSGIATGKIVDNLRDKFKNDGFHNFLINAGGDIYVSGKNIHGKKWRIAIQDPFSEDRYSGILEKTDMAIVTSGDYERFFEVDGVRYSHLFNPNNGYPASENKSVTILAPDTIIADAMSTAIFVMGSRKGYNFLMDNKIEGFIIYLTADDKRESISTPGFWK